MEQKHHHSNSMKHMFTSLFPHFIVMYFVMYTMIDSFKDLYNNINQVYMTVMMVSAMGILMTISMKDMYHKKVRQISYVVLSILFILGFSFMREQTLVGDKQFLRSMIPHHSGAVLMCKKASINDPEIKKLCESIISSQKSEIDQMNKILDRL